jgi:hypothetical protein
LEEGNKNQQDINSYRYIFIYHEGFFPGLFGIGGGGQKQTGYSTSI